MLEDNEKLKKLAKWIIGIFTCCILIFLGIKYFNDIAQFVSKCIGYAGPLFLGMIFALILNVPMGFFEKLLKKKMNRFVSPLSIVLSIVLVLGIFAGVSVLVVPELAKAISLIIDIVLNSIDKLEGLDASSFDFVSDAIASIDIDWMAIKSSVETWFMSFGKNFVNHAANMIGSVVSGFITFFVGLIFSIYILSSKEKLMKQTGRLIRAWIPEKFANYFIHVCEVCNNVFKLYVAGQATEAIILGTLCMIGMLILGMPYAPMIGALVGVTALIPIVGAFVGCIVGFIMILTISPFKALIFVVFFLVLQQIEGNMIYPKVVGSKINLPAIWVLAAVTIGGNIGGILGMLFSVPVTSSLYTLVKEATKNREKSLKINTK